MKYDLSIIIPSRSEIFLAKTIEDILKHKEGNTEIIIGLDGEWADPVVKDHEDVSIYHTSKSIGQRAITNQCVRLSKAKWIMKLDAHCSVDQGFDRILMEDMKDNWTMVPAMRNLWAFDWKCMKCGHRRYQSPTPTSCPDCDNETDFKRKITWKTEAKKGSTGYKNWKRSRSPISTSYCFDNEPHFQYFGEYTRRPKYLKDLKKTGLTETMSLQGSCWMATREKYWKLGLCDEVFGSWGSQGIEVACKTWLSGGKVIVNHKTWYAHLFRTQGGDFSFPYPQKESKVQEAKVYAKDLFFNNKWDKAVRPLSWLIERFMPIKGWTQKDLDDLKR